MTDALPSSSPTDLTGIADPLPSLPDLWQSTLHWCPTAVQHQQFQQVYDVVREANQQLNLTRITAPLEFWEKHLWDSLRGLKPWLGDAPELFLPGADPSPEASSLERSPLKLIDIGTGGGFPGVPAAIALPQSQGVLLDATQKKITFLQSLIHRLSLPHLSTVLSRAEALGHHPQHRGQYHLALLRAVAPASVCAEYALPLLAPDGVAVLYRGQWSDDETHALIRACQQLGGVIEAIDGFTTPLTQSQRHCVYVRKIRSTPQTFPRAVGVPAKHPLGGGSGPTRTTEPVPRG